MSVYAYPTCSDRHIRTFFSGFGGTDNLLWLTRERQVVGCTYYNSAFNEMIRFLLQRPIAVLMAFTAFFILGLATYFTLPVSLLPDIAIPEITVQVTGANCSARELERRSLPC